MKKFGKSLIALLFVAVSGCNNYSKNISLLPQPVYNQNAVSLAKNKNNFKVRSDWFETLSPELQSYYAQAKGKTGSALFDALHDIISRNNSVSNYQEAKSFIYSTADNTIFRNRPGLYDVYSYVFVPGTGGNGNLYKENGDENSDGYPQDFINCEHTWPQSFFGKKLPMVADLHHIFPSLSVPNAMRSDNPFGSISSERKVIYTTNGGSKLGVIDSKNRSLEELTRLINLPYEQRPGLEDELDSVFEPGDRQKGNTARAMLYFYLRYYDQDIRGGDFQEQQFWDSKVSTFISWSSVDPVDESEKRRHEFAFKKQKNRNPFVDIPGLAVLIGENVLKTK